MGANIASSELWMANIRNQGEHLGYLSSRNNKTGLKIRFKNDIRPEQTLIIELWHCKYRLFGNYRKMSDKEGDAKFDYRITSNRAPRGSIFRSTSGRGVLLEGGAVKEVSLANYATNRERSSDYLHFLIQNHHFFEMQISH